MTRVIAAATPASGHVIPMRKIARELVRHGYDVTFLTGSRFRDAIVETGARFVPLRGKADYDALRMVEEFPG